MFKFFKKYHVPSLKQRPNIEFIKACHSLKGKLSDIKILTEHQILKIARQTIFPQGKEIDLKQMQGVSAFLRQFPQVIQDGASSYEKHLKNMKNKVKN